MVPLLGALLQFSTIKALPEILKCATFKLNFLLEPGYYGDQFVHNLTKSLDVKRWVYRFFTTLFGNFKFPYLLDHNIQLKVPLRHHNCRSSAHLFYVSSHNTNFA